MLLKQQANILKFILDSDNMIFMLNWASCFLAEASFLI